MLPIDAFQDFIRQQQLFEPDDKILLAVSGGKDSVLMFELFKALNLNIGIAHCNFMLRGEDALKDEAFVRQLAKTAGYPFYVQRFDTKAFAQKHKISTQMAARDLRYAWFDSLKQSKGYDYVALAQHQNDVIETMLINLCRGTGIRGLHGIAAKRKHYIRPLLFLNGAEIAHHIDHLGIAYREDLSNASIDYHRNFIRHEIVPKLQELNPQVVDTFQQNSKRFAQMEALLDMQLQKLKLEAISEKDGLIYIDINKLQTFEPLALFAYELLAPYGFNAGMVNDLLQSGKNLSGRLFESSDYQLYTDRDFYVVKPKEKTESLQLVLPQPGQFQFNGWELEVSEKQDIHFEKHPLKIFVDSADLIYPLQLRYWQQGDRFKPFGMKHFKNLSDFFIDQKISIPEKNRCPLLINGNGDLIWLAGLRQDDRYKIHQSTKKVTIFEIKKHHIGE